MNKVLDGLFTFLRDIEHRDLTPEEIAEGERFAAVAAEAHKGDEPSSHLYVGQSWHHGAAPAPATSRADHPQLPRPKKKYTLR